MKEVKDKSNSLNVRYIELVFMIKVLNIPRYPTMNSESMIF